ncbi:putative base plate wedge subunit [Escherichia phage HY03]|jgi:phage baseplate assembly protein W|uniref:Base plate protein gp25 n=25 Tax=Tequatrovirus TaxID=10663 RepID=Q779L1_BPR32|nr:GPW/gp25 family protein [Salmonella enterica]YP_002854521.1 baseplate wedge subunit [Escherichia phage RB14]YP_009098571.1 baseplate wedge subunit [Escherichia phage RB3]YP_009102389.1 baseplate wedge subunit [Enterobacteria phage RB27]YP_009153787.1 baseplate wedge subunit [Yersinia phage PST]YP_009180686.1 baseplate wedge subunit [Escherichia phage slur14]YP_009284051.1 baseplate wedge subunit [Escherichia phage HY03]YP_009625064.1 baseplate wedge subunit [Escherichia phage slur03]YP_0
MANINKLYSDIDPEMKMDWNKDVSRSLGLRSIKNSLLGIITTRKGSRPFDPEFGCDLSDQLFENMTPLTADTVERNIESAVRNYEPRIDKLSVNVIPVYDDYTLIVEIRFSVIDNPDDIEQIKLQLASSNRV